MSQAISRPRPCRPARSSWGTMLGRHRSSSLQIRGTLATDYADIYTPAALDALNALAVLDPERTALMGGRPPRRADRARDGKRIQFLDPDATIGRTTLTVREARAGQFEGSEIPRDLQRQWIQGTGPAAKT